MVLEYCWRLSKCITNPFHYAQIHYRCNSRKLCHWQRQPAALAPTQRYAALGDIDCMFAHLLTKTLKIMLKKINIQVGLFLMLAIFGCGKSKGDKGKASTPAARKANMEKALKGPAGIASRKKILETLKKVAKTVPANASVDEAQLEAALAPNLDKQITQTVEYLSSEEKVTLADVQNIVDKINSSHMQGVPDDLLQALKTNSKELAHLLIKAHGGLQKK